MSPAEPSVLVTGAGGFIGGHLLRELAASDGRPVIALVHATGRGAGRPEPEDPGLTLVAGDLCNLDLLESLFRSRRIAQVVHLAALRGPGRGGDGLYRAVNVWGTELLLDLALRHGTQRFLFCSSVGVHGTIPGELPCRAGSPLRGDNAYHRSKIEAEAAVCRAAGKGLDAWIIRPTITYGPGDDGFPARLVRLVRRRSLPVPRRGNRVHLLDVRSLARLLRALLENGPPGERVILAADEAPVRLRDLADLIHRQARGSDYPAWLELPRPCFGALLLAARAAGRRRLADRLRLIGRDWYYDISAMRQVPGVRPAATLEAFAEYLRAEG